MTLEELIAEIESDFSTLADSGDIDHAKIRLIVYNELRIFGNNILKDNEAVLRIKNGSTKLPENFRSLFVAIKCDPYCYEIMGDKDTIQTSYFWQKRVESELLWNEKTQEYEKGCDKLITETVYYRDNSVKFFYKNPRFLKLTRGFNKNLCTKDCLSLPKYIRDTSANEINITNTILNTNFDKGYVYIQYKGYETDDNGDIIIPETWHNRVQEYLMWYIKYRITIDLIGKNRNVPTLEKLLPTYKQESENAKGLALTEVAASKINKGTFEKIRNRNRLESLKYELSFPLI